jgi:membrane-bound inhibitor of C-type lysozyme
MDQSMFSRNLIRSIAIGAAAIAVGGGASGIVIATASTGSGTATTATSPSSTSGQHALGSGGSNARSGPAVGGSIGKVSSVSTSGFGLLTSAGEKVTVKETSSTTYKKGTKSASATAVTKGQTALVLGTTDSTTITATQVIVQPTNSGSKSSSKVVPFTRGAPSTSKQVGQVPANYKEGSGTIVSGTTANKATKAALAAYPGGIVDRVVKLSNGEYEVHNIGVNWPHHIFVTKGFKVVGAD